MVNNNVILFIIWVFKTDYPYLLKFTFGVKSGWKAFLAEDGLWENCFVHWTSPIVLDDNATEKNPAVKALEMAKCVFIH